MSELKSCPFCGGELLVDGKFYVHPVVGCLLDGIPIRNDTESIKRWNTRKPMQNIIERLENRIKYCEYCHEEFNNSKNSLMYEVQLNSYKNAIEIVKEEGGLHERI